MRPSLILITTGLLLAGCANEFWRPPAYESAIKRYYEAHASEKTGRCLAPYVDGFTRVQIVEETPERLVIDARYLFRDRVKGRSAENGRVDAECVGYNGRRFVLAKTDDRLEVIEMSGPRRN